MTDRLLIKKSKQVSLKFIEILENDLLKYIAKALSQIRSQTKVELVDDAEGKKRRTKKKK